MMAVGSYSLRSYWSVVRIYFSTTGKLGKAAGLKRAIFTLYSQIWWVKTIFFLLWRFFTVPVTRNRIKKTFFSP